MHGLSCQFRIARLLQNKGSIIVAILSRALEGSFPCTILHIQTSACSDQKLSELHHLLTKPWL